MAIQKDLRMRKFIQATISSAEFIGIPTNNFFDKSVRYIHDNKSWERQYVLLEILFPCLRVLCLADSNRAGMDTVYYYSRVTKQCIEKKNQILIIRNSSQSYCHHPIYGTSQMTKVTKTSQYQTIVQRIQTIYVFPYQSCGIKERNISILSMLLLVGCYV